MKMRKREVKIGQQVRDKNYGFLGIGIINDMTPEYIRVSFPGKVSMITMNYLLNEVRSLKRFPELRHKGVRSPTGTYDYCTNRITLSPYSMKWNEVTCRNCLKKRG
jgi:hypothetical protein